MPAVSSVRWIFLPFLQRQFYVSPYGVWQRLLKNTTPTPPPNSQLIWKRHFPAKSNISEQTAEPSSRTALPPFWANSLCFYATYLFYSSEDFARQLKAYNRKDYNDFPMRPLGCKTPNEVLLEYLNSLYVTNVWQTYI